MVRPAVEARRYAYAMAAQRKDLDVELARLYRGPQGEFTKARNDLAKQLRKLGKPKEAEYVRTLAKPTPSAWAVNQLFEREPARMDTLLAAGKRARAGQREAVSGRGAAALRESLQAARGVMDDLRRRAGEILRESGGSASRAILDRIATDLQALAFSPAAAEAADRRWLSRDLDPPGFEVLAGLQLAGAPVVDLEARKAKQAERRETKQPAREAEGKAREERESQRQEAAERARREREEERIRRRLEVAQEKVSRARGEAEEERQHAEKAEKTAAEARRQVDAAEVAARRAREKADRAAERLARAQEELQEARGGGS